MSSYKNAIPRRAHKERAQPHDRKNFGLLEKHKDYIKRAEAFHQKEKTLQKLKEKAAFRNPDEFYFKMVRSKTVDGVHRMESQVNKYTPEELMLMKTQDIGYILQKVQSEKKKIERLTATLHSLDNQPSNRRVYYAEDSITTNAKLRFLCENLEVRVLSDVETLEGVLDEMREEAEQLVSKASERSNLAASENLASSIRRKTAASYRELEARNSRMRNLEKLYMDMAMQKELQKAGRKRKLREDELVNPTTKPVYKWRQERKR